MRVSARTLPLFALFAAACRLPPGPVVSIDPPRRARPPPAGGRRGAENSFARRRLWQGRYLRARGETELVSRVRDVRGDAVVAAFEFAHPPTRARGAYVVAGTYKRRERTLELEPVRWLSRPTT